MEPRARFNMEFSKFYAQTAFTMLRVCSLLLFLISASNAQGPVGCPLIAPVSAYFPSMPPLFTCYNAIGELNSTIASWKADNPDTLYAVSVVHLNETVYTNGLADTTFLIGSITKTFTALGALILRDKGLLSLDDPVKKFLPNFTIINPYEPHDITLRELMGHTSGLPRELCASFVIIGLSEEECPVNEADVLKAIANMELVRPAWSREPAYSNLGYALLGHAWEKATSPSKSWQQFLEEDILKPLGMSKTGVNLTGITLPTKDSGANYDIGWVGPAGNMYSTAADLAKYLLFLLNAEPGLISAPTIREWTNTRTLFPDGNGGFALPWELLPLEIAGREFLITKGGMITNQNFSYQSIMAIHAPTRLGVSILLAQDSSSSLLEEASSPGPFPLLEAMFNILITKVEAATAKVLDTAYIGHYVCPAAPPSFLGGVIDVSGSPSLGLSASYNVSILQGNQQINLKSTSSMLLKNANDNSFWLGDGTDCTDLFMIISARPDRKNPNHPETAYLNQIEYSLPDKTLLWPAYGALCHLK